MTRQCFMVKEPLKLRIIVCYIFVSHGTNCESYAPRFVETYKKFRAGYDHKMIVIQNGGKPPVHRAEYFKSIIADEFERENDGGKDISGYKSVANRDCDLMVCLGESVYFHREGWLGRIAEERIKYGPGMYGFFSSHAVRAHLNTTAFAVDTSLLAAYPKVLNHEQRYAFEHGPKCLWRRIFASNLAARLVTFDGSYGPGQWRDPENIMARGDQSNCLAWCNHTDRYKFGSAVNKTEMEKSCDQPFK